MIACGYGGGLLVVVNADYPSCHYSKGGLGLGFSKLSPITKSTRIYSAAPTFPDLPSLYPYF